MSADGVLEVSPVGRDSATGQRFFAYLNELVGHVKQYLASDEGTVSEKCCKMMEEAFESLEKYSLDDTFKDVASIIATSPEILQVVHNFMSKVSSGEYLVFL
jgi:hypothetical protein